MRRPRNRNAIRKSRPHTNSEYNAMAARIQTCFREFCTRRYKSRCVNYNDADFISMTPVGEIPRDLLFVSGNRGYDARQLFTWMLKTNVDPISREKFSVGQRRECAQQLKRFIARSRKTQVGSKGFFSRHREVSKALKLYAKFPENG